ncbi:MAG: ABC transporter permease, partial [Lactobacillus iners]|nr:ABC transporter permease [Lactobacillus iners]
MKKFKWDKFYLTFILLTLYIPIFYLIIYSFSSGN